MEISRRHLLRTSLAAAAIRAIRPARAATASGSSGQKLRIGLIGAGGMGSANLQACLKAPDTELTAVCDVQTSRCKAWIERCPGAKAYHDFRELLASPAVDAVVIATPPHWHCLQAVMAAQAGKHLYLQKPMTLYPAETLAVRNAVRRHKVICQIGTQIHQGTNYRRMVEWVRSGRLGPIGRVEAFWSWNRGKDGIGRAPVEDAPKDIDFDLWCGPAPLIPFNQLLVQDASKHCSWMAYSGGWTPGMAPHLLDLPVWALDLPFPSKTCSFGARSMTGGDGDAPDTQEILWQYPNGMTMRWHFCTGNHHGYNFRSGVRAMGVWFHGLHGTLRGDYDSHELDPQDATLDPKSPPPPALPEGGCHEHEWIACIRSGAQPSCNADYHAKVDMACTLGNLSMALGRTIHFDPATEKITGDDEAARRAIPEYRAPWKFPEEYL